MLLFIRKKFSGSYVAFTSASRRRLRPSALSTPAVTSSSASPVKLR